LFEVVLNTSRVLGPAIGGVILTAAGPAPCFAVNALSYIAPIIVLLRHRPHSHTTLDRPMRRQRGAVREGLRYVKSVPEIRACVAIAAASGLIVNGVVFYPMLATDAFHLDGGGYAALVAAFGAGALPGALLAARSKGRPSGRVVVVLAASTTCSMAITAFAPTLWLVSSAWCSAALHPFGTSQPPTHWSSCGQPPSYGAGSWECGSWRCPARIR